MWTTAWANLTPVASATGLAPCSNAGALPSLLAIAIATETNWTPWASVVATARPTPMATECATSTTIASILRKIVFFSRFSLTPFEKV